MALTNVVLTGIQCVLCFSQCHNSWSGRCTRYPCCRNRRYCRCLHTPSLPFIQVSRVAAFYLTTFSLLVAFIALLRPGRGAEYCNQFVCVSACLSACVFLSIREHISGTAGPIFTKFVTQIHCDRGSFLLWWPFDMLCTSGFIDDVTFGSNEFISRSVHARSQICVQRLRFVPPWLTDRHTQTVF